MDILRAELAVNGRFIIEDLRQFNGPEAPGGDRAAVIERWYVKVRLEGDPSVAGRFLVEVWTDGAQVAAVAPSGTSGWRSPDWSAFTGEGERTAYPGLPGRWAGTRYDFVTGEGGPGTRGLPGAVEGCVSDT